MNTSNQYSGAYSRRKYSQTLKQSTLASEGKPDGAFQASSGTGTGGSDPETKTATVHVAWNRDRGNVTTTGNNMQDGAIAVKVGNQVTLTATPKAGFQFARWEFSQRMPADATGNPATFTVDTDMRVVAIFEEDKADSPEHSGEPLGNSYNSMLRQEGLVDRIVPFVKKWWWAILIAAYVVYKEKKGGKL